MRKGLVLMMIVFLCFSMFLPLLSIDSVVCSAPRTIRVIDSVTGLNSTSIRNSTDLPSRGVQFGLNVSLNGLTSDLASWQVALTFDNNTFFCTSLVVPQSDPSYVFHGITEFPMIDFSNDTQSGKYTGKPQVVGGSTLFDPSNAVTVENALLCILNFTVIGVGKSSTMTISFLPNDPTPNTFLWDSNSVDIAFETEIFSVNFIQDVYILTVNTIGSGVVNLNNSGPFYYGDVVELTAVSSIDWSFDHWSGDLTGSTNPATILIDSNKTLTATFTQNTYTLTVSITGSGTVNRNNSGPYYKGDVVELTAAPAVGWSFDKWTGDFTGSTNPTTILIDGDKEVTATFIRNAYTLTTNIIGNGTVNLNNSGPYYYGDVLQLTAVPAIGWNFNHWSQDLTGSTNPTVLLIDGNKIVNATFTEGTHDIAVTDLNPYKTVIGRGYTCNLTVTVENHGVSTETFNLTLYANTTVIAIIPDLTLPVAGSTTQTIVWNTTGFSYGNYTLSAVADIVPGETSPQDNTYVSPAQMHVGIPGDVSSSAPGVYDKVCNMRDIAYMIALFNTRSESPNWNPNADVNNDGVCNMKDIAIAIAYFNQHE